MSTTRVSRRLHQLQATAGDVGCRLDASGVLQAIAELSPSLMIDHQLFEPVRDTAQLPFVLTHPRTPGRGLEGVRIRDLMILAGSREWNDERRQARGRELGQRDRPGGAHRKVRPLVGYDDVVDERRYHRGDRGLGVRNRRSRTQCACLMLDLELIPTARQLRDDLGNPSVEKRRAQRPAKDQQTGCCRRWAASLRVQRPNLRPDRNTGHDHLATAKRRGGLRPSDKNRVGTASQHAVRQPGCDVRLTDCNRQSPSARRQDGSRGCISTERQQRFGAGALEDLRRGSHAGNGVGNGSQLAADSGTEERRAGDQLERKVRGGNEPAFEPQLGAQEANVAVRHQAAKRRGDGKRRVDVPGGTAADDGEMALRSIRCCCWNWNLPLARPALGSRQSPAMLSCMERR